MEPKPKERIVFDEDLYNSPELCAAPPLRGAVLRMPF